MPPRSLHSRLRALRYARGEDRVEDEILGPATIAQVLRRLSAQVGGLADSPEIRARASEVLQSRFDSDEGGDITNMPHYGILEDDDLAAFHGVDVSRVESGQRIHETVADRKDRLVSETVAILEVELPGLVQMQNHFENESWARYGAATERPLVHSNADMTLFRNPGGGWATVDRPIATADKTNTINLYDAQPAFTHPRQHPAWLVDEDGGYFDQLGRPPLL